jgi:membrane associated rhomboid family serine protease
VDGLINFSHYSLPQLKELQHSIDPQSFPINARNLHAALEQLQQSVGAPIEETPEVPIRFSAHEGLRGWLEAKWRRQSLYGAGTIEILPDEIRIRGSCRTWLGVATSAEEVLAPAAICNVLQDGERLQFEAKRRARWRKRYLLSAQSATVAEKLCSKLPQERTANFQRSTLDPWTFNRALLKATPRVWITPTIVATNILVFAAMALLYRNLGDFDLVQLSVWGANGPLTLAGQWWRLWTALFVHINVLHLALNMWALWNVGRITERLFGRWLFLGIYVSVGLLASVTSLLWNPGLISVGASGAIFGLIGAFIAFLSKRRSGVPATVIRSHWLPTLAFTLFNLADGLLQPGIDNAAHVGGLLSGFALGWILARPLEQRGKLLWPQVALAAALVACCFAAVVGQVSGLRKQITGPEQYLLAHSWYPKGEEENLRVWQDLANQAGAGTMSDAELGARFSKDILPFWKLASERLQREDQAVPPSQRSFAEELHTYADLRMKWAQAIIDATTSQDANRAQEAQRLMQQANLSQAREQRLGMRARMDNRPRALASNAWIVRLRDVLTFKKQRCVAYPLSLHLPISATDARSDSPVFRYTDACDAQRLFLEGNYRALDDLMNRSISSLTDLPDGSSSLSAEFGGLDDLFGFGTLSVDEALGRTADWRRQVPGSLNADLVEAMLFEVWAWSARGHGYASNVTAQGWMQFALRDEMAAAGLRELSDRADVNPYWYVLSIQVGLDQAVGEDKLQQIFDQGAIKYPTFDALLSARLRTLMPRWSGSYRQVDQFIVEQTARAPELDRDLLYARLYWNYDSLELDTANIFSDGMARWDRVQQGFQRWIERYPRSDYVLNGFTRMACLAKQWGEFATLRPQLKTRYSASVWTKQVTLESCDADFKEHSLPAPSIPPQLVEPSSFDSTPVGLLWPVNSPAAQRPEQRALRLKLAAVQSKESVALKRLLRVDELERTKALTFDQWAQQITANVIPLWSEAIDTLDDIPSPKDADSESLLTAVRDYLITRRIALRKIGEAYADHDSQHEDWIPVMISSNNKAQVASDLLRGSY